MAVEHNVIACFIASSSFACSCHFRASTYQLRYCEQSLGNEVTELKDPIKMDADMPRWIRREAPVGGSGDEELCSAFGRKRAD